MSEGKNPSGEHLVVLGTNLKGHEADAESHPTGRLYCHV